ncbi:unnamed protein product, partial [Ilex paraguariensis]
FQTQKTVQEIRTDELKYSEKQARSEKNLKKQKIYRDIFKIPLAKGIKTTCLLVVAVI